ncbi:MAG: flagellar hook-associated protein FlgL [Clostridiaceae bacterium]
MRITNNTLTDGYLRNLSRNLNQMQKYQNQLSSGKEVSKPSDNPMAVSKIMNLDNSIKTNEQYNRNIDDALGWVKTADGSLGEVTSSLLRARDLIIYGANGTLSDTDRSALADEVEQLSGQLTQVLNTNYDGRYIFGGQATTTPPFSLGTDGVMAYNGKGGNITREIANGVNVGIPSQGDKITTVSGTTGTGNADVGNLLKNIVTALRDGNTNELSGNLLGDIDKHIDNVIQVRSKMGTTYNRLEASSLRNEAENLNMTELKSKNEDIDLAKKMMEFSVMSTVYEASLSVGAKVLQSSLLDYMR